MYLEFASQVQGDMLLLVWVPHFGNHYQGQKNKEVPSTQYLALLISYKWEGALRRGT